jgi:hypothetical protein
LEGGGEALAGRFELMGIVPATWVSTGLAEVEVGENTDAHEDCLRLMARLVATVIVPGIGDEGQGFERRGVSQPG